MMNEEVFISYAAKDRDRVLDLVKRLREAGVSVWIDQAGIDVATMWSQEIVGAIRGCKVMLLAISRQSTESGNVVKELALASERKKPIIPVYLEPTDIPETMEYQLAGIQRVEYFAEKEDAAFRAMARSLAKRGVGVDAAKAELEGSDPFEASLATHQFRAVPRRTNLPRKFVLIVGTSIAVFITALLLLLAKDTSPENSINTTANQAKQSRASATNKKALDQTQEKNKSKIFHTLSTNKLVVLPFNVLGESRKGEDFSFGLVSDLTMKLQRLKGLTVISERSGDAYKDDSKTLQEIGELLDVGSIITGDVLESDGEVRVNVKLVDANNGAIQWSESFDDTLSGLLKLQSKIAQSVAKQLKGVLGVEETAELNKAETTSAEAYQLYIQGRRLWVKRTKEDFDKALGVFNQAIELDENFALAYVGIADVRLMESLYSISMPKDSIGKAKEASHKALQINPYLGEALTNLAMITLIYDYDLPKAEELFLKSMKANPNHSTTYTWGGLACMVSGRYDEAVERAKNAAKLDPLSPIASHGISFSQIHAKNLIASKEEALKNLIMNPGFHRSIWDLSTCFILENEPTKVIDLFEREKPNMKQLTRLYLVLGVAHYKAGNKEQSYQLLIELITLSQQIYVAKEIIAEFCLVVGLEDQGFYWLQKAVDEKSTSLIFYHPYISKKYHNHKKYRSIMSAVKGRVEWSYP